ncbi:MAG: hypothetical protein ACOYN0_05685 [Phycisphaerales bacterium]
MTTAPTCINCAYPLSNLATSGVCPECGAPASASARVEQLRDSSLGYLRSVRTGVRLQVVGMLGIFAVLPGEAFDLNPAAARAADIVVLGFTLATCVGGWLIASADPGRANDEVFTRLTVRTRAWTIVAASAETAAELQRMVLQGTLSSVVASLGTLVGMGAAIYVCVTLASLARRTTNAQLMGRSSRLVKLARAAFVGMAILTGLDFALQSLAPPSALLDVGFMVCALFLLLLMLAYLISSIQVAIGFLRELRAAIAHQRALESTPTPS